MIKFSSMITFLFLTVELHAAQPSATESGFQKHAAPFLKQYCIQCHNAEKMNSGIRVDHLTAGFADNEIRLWDAILHQVKDEAMPPKGKAQPTNLERQQLISWIKSSTDIARLRPMPKRPLRLLHLNLSLASMKLRQMRNLLMSFIPLAP